MARLIFTISLATLLLTALVHPVIGDPNDWVSIDYVIQRHELQSTVDARAFILQSASSTANSGPWSITNAKVLPPSQDPHDYLSWAPYHWPNCDWCPNGQKHIAQNPNSTNDGNDTEPSNGSDPNVPYLDNGSNSQVPPDPYTEIYSEGDTRISHEEAAEVHNFHSANDTMLPKQPYSTPQSRMLRVKRPFIGIDIAALDEIPGIPGKSPTTSTDRHKQTAFTLYQVGPEPSPEVPILHDPAAPPGPTSPAGGLPENPVLPGSQTSDQVISGTQAPAQDPARTRKPKCTPSNTSLAPSATWTTCPYAVRDGRVNPDVRTLAGVPAINGASQSILYNAIAYALSRDRSYSQNVAAFVDAFFLTPSTRMNPNMNFGQVVRGPGFSGREGTFTGILDLRGIVKIVNGIFIMRGTSAPDWTATRDQTMTTWMTQYIGWLQSSTLGGKAASRPNNHGSFFASQLAATQMLTGDVKSAMATLEYYFSHQFQDQVAASGEQPFEAVRTRPYHYRCFNLEAMITNAKLGDQLGLDLWTTKSKYGATIQDALDYTMELDPKNENVADIFPHVGAIAAAYGDPDGKYSGFLQQRDSAYRSQSFWYYDQTVALPRSPAARGNTRRSAGVESDQTSGSDTSSSFICPGIFGTTPNQPVEIADGIFVTCDQLKEFYLPRLS